MVRITISVLIRVFTSIIILSSCSQTGSHQIDLMPAPDVYEEGMVNPFTDVNPIENIPYKGVLYATDREPADEEQAESFYLNERGHLIRLGYGSISLGQEDITWEEARQISLLKNRTDKYPLRITAVKEVGILDRSLNVFTESELIPDDLHGPANEFSGLVNNKLAVSKNKDVYIYVHGYKVVFENPLLVASELWHFLGYEGVFIAYAWPSTPSLWAYVADLENAAYSARNLRLLIEYLAEETKAERIHIIGYSAGTRVVISALQQLKLKNMKENKTNIQDKLRIGNVILVGSDFDKDIFAGYLDDGFLHVAKRLVVYMSEGDKALGFSKLLFGRERLGQIILKDQMNPKVVEFLTDNKEVLNIIDVTKAAHATSGNGHAYFRKSPWVSSDILMTLMYGLSPEDRGLVNANNSPVWVFPEDYIKRLREKLLDLL